MKRVSQILFAVMSVSFMANLAQAPPRHSIPSAPTDLVAALDPGGAVLLTWVNNYLPAKKGGGSITVLRGVSFQLSNDPYWGSKYSYVAWTPVSKPLPLTTTAFVDVLPPGTDLASVRYRVLVRNLGVTIGSEVVSITQPDP